MTRRLQFSMNRISRVVCLASLSTGALWLQAHAPAQARALSSNTAQDIVGKLELTVHAEVTGRYSEETHNRGAGSDPRIGHQRVEDKMSVTMMGTTEWPITSRGGFDEPLFQIEPDAFPTSLNGQGGFNGTETHSDRCGDHEGSYTDTNDRTWTSRKARPAAGAADPAPLFGIGQLLVTRDTVDPDRGMYLLGIVIPTDIPTVTGQGTMTSRTHPDCGGTVAHNYSLTSTLISDGGAFAIVSETLKEAMEDAAFTAEFKGTFDRHSKGFSVTRHALFRYAPTDDVLDTAGGGRDDGWVRSVTHHEGFLTLTYTLTYHVESDVDAVIEPEAGYDDWMPEAPSGTYEPRPLEIHVRVHKKGDPDARASEPARFRFELVDTSQEFGYCLNAPNRPDSDFEPPPPDEPFDLEIGAKDNPALKISNKGQRAETKDGLIDATVLINSADWGGYSGLKVTAILKDGTEIVAHLAKDAAKRELRVPIDDNNNQIADAWEKSLEIFDRKLPADWNEADDPAKQLKVGDGISLYEKYRGFEFDGRHESLQPTKKYLFLYDQDRMYREIFATPETAGLDFASLSRLEVRLVADTEWTGIGAAAEGHRTVNFNHRTGHADDQHAVHLSAKYPFPQGYAGYQGLTFPDGANVFGPPRTALVAAVHIGAIDNDLTDHAEKVVCALPRPTGPLPYPACANDAIAKAYLTVHFVEKDYAEAIFKKTALVITHELAHAVGVQHHDGNVDGDRQCVMRYFKNAACGLDPVDLFQLKCRSPWPSKLVGPDAQSHAGMGCFQQIIVNDAR